MGRLGAKEDLRTGQANHGGMLIFGRSRAILPSAPEGQAEGALGYSCDHPNHELSGEPVPLRSRLIAMTDDEFVTYKAERYDAQLKYYDQKAVRNRRCYHILSVYVILASLAVGPSITLPLLVKWHGRTLACLLSLTVALGTAPLGHFSFQENWLKARASWDQLKHELYWRDAKAGPYVDAEDRNTRFVERVEELIAREAREWLERQPAQRAQLHS